MSLAEKITDAELEVMKILWRERRQVSFTELWTELHRTVGWEKPTIQTLIRRLAEKNVITAEKLNILHYTPNVTETEYVQAQEQQMLDKLYGGSAKKFVAALVSGGKLSESDIDELKAYFVVGERDE
ncbi:MAG: BlaI/MecI/CopY family transcriptional regulator [Oscillospiraceae bacterium]|nr:BlaI/MecI/CopY family transcriptional regulator [Oscillospiraceae bacterium]